MNIKKIGITFVALFLLSGCLDEIIKKLCDRLPSDNAIIAIFESEDIMLYQNKKVVLVYSNEDDIESNSLIISECDDGLKFPNGSKLYFNETNKKEIVITKILDSSARSFFTVDGNQFNEVDNYSVEIQFYEDCDSIVPDQVFSSIPRQLQWDQIQLPEEVKDTLEQCDINGVSETIRVFDSIL